MGQLMYGMIVALAVAASPNGCQSVSNKLEEPGPASGKVTKRETLIDRDVPKSDSCELKNPAGTGQCEDGRHATGEKRKTTYSSYGPCRVMEPFEGETVADWKKRDPKGTRCMVEENKRSLAKLDEIKAWNEKNERLEQERQEAESRVPTQNAETTDTSGTWYCDDSVDGSGNYGTWEMTQQSDRFYNCKRAN